MAQPVHGGNLAWAAYLAGCSPRDILDFSASINPLGPPPSAIAAIQSALPTLRDYPDPDYRALRCVLGEMHHLSADWILPGNGAAELLTWACRELASLDRVYLYTPTFGDYLRGLKAFAATVEKCLLDLEALGFSSGLLPVPDASPRMGLLLNNPHNPTGQLFGREVLLPHLSQFGLVVIDEAFMDFLPPDQQQSLVEEVVHYPNVVILRSLTKFYSIPGLRLGYAIAHPDRLQRWSQWRDPWSVNTLAVAAGEAMLQDDAFQQQTLDWLLQARPQLFQSLQRIPGLYPYPGAANFLLVRSEYSVVQLQHQLLQHHRILIRDCLSFPELGDRYFRVAVRKESENQRLLEGLAQVLSTT